MQKQSFIFQKLSLTAIGILVAVGALFFGIYYNNLPEEQHKYLMPGEYHALLKSDYYTVWYYPEWKKTALKDIREVNYLKEPPQVFIESNNGTTAQLSTSKISPKYPNAGYFGEHIVVKLGRIYVPTPGRYRIVGKCKENAEFVIAVVPPNAESKSPMGPPFYGFYHEKLEKK